MPKSTIYWWARRGALVPDFYEEKPKMWSYRDLVWARLMTWLRIKGMDLDQASSRILLVQERLRGLDDEEIATVSSDGRTLLLGDDVIDGLSGQHVFAALRTYLSTFDLLAPLVKPATVGPTDWPAVLPEEFRPALLGPGRQEALIHFEASESPRIKNSRKPSVRTWGPDLVRPTARTRISPWVMAGDPCIANTRIPTAGVWALATERHLSKDDIADLYPEVGVRAIEEAIHLEQRLRAA